MIQAKQLYHTYQPNSPLSYNALSDINFSIEKQQITAIVGHTGSGKSTLIQHFNGWLQPTNGILHVLDQHVTKRAKPKRLFNLRQRVGIVFQSPETQLFEATVLDDIIFGPMRYGMSKEDAIDRAYRLADELGLDRSLLDRNPIQLSGGEKRRVALLCIIAMNPDILVLDEPTAALDYKGVQDVMKMIHTLRCQGITIIIVSHDMDLVAELSDATIELSDGRLSFVGSTDQYIDHLYTSNLVEQLPTIVRLQLRAGYSIDDCIIKEKDFIEQWRIRHAKR